MMCYDRFFNHWTASYCKKWVFLFLLLTISPLLTFTSAQQQYNQALKAVLELNPDAKALAVKVKDNPATLGKGIYLEHYIDFLKLLTYDAPLDAQTFPLLTNARLEQLSRLKRTNDIDACICQMYLHLSFANALKGDYMKSAKNVWQSYQRFEQLRKNDPSRLSPETEKLEAIFKVMFEMIPQDYQWLASMMQMKGDIQTGFKGIDSYCSKISDNDGLLLEGRLIEAMLHHYFDAHLKNFKLTALSDSNVLCCYLKAAIAVKSRQLFDYKNIKPKFAIQFPLLSYTLGRIALNSQDDKCLAYFDLFDQKYEGDSFKADINLRKAWYYKIVGTNENIEQYKRNISLLKHLPTVADKQAVKEIELVDTYPVFLLKSRLLFDGGFYQKALETLETANEVSCEYYYRLGRIHQELGNKNKAIENFGLCISNNNKPLRYFAANAALQMALIEFENANFSLALKHLDQCEQLNMDEYKEDIKNSAAQLRHSIVLKSQR
jgi:predicted negative regulator of RcsB-dependent stress response